MKDSDTFGEWSSIILNTENQFNWKESRVSRS